MPRTESSINAMDTPGCAAASASRRARTRPATVTSLAPLARYTAKATTGVAPSSRAKRRGSSNPSVTLATSDSRSSRPSGSTMRLAASP